MALEILQIPVMTDNYIYLLHDDTTGVTAAVDPALAPPVIKKLEEQGWDLDLILNTHHHPDHVGGNMQLKEKYDCKIYGYGEDAKRITGITNKLNDEDSVFVGCYEAKVLFTPGHTLGHICYHFDSEQALFCGDTLFLFGCGRLFEGTPEMMKLSLERLRALPDETLFYCAHEYTLKNLECCLSIEPHNQELKRTYEFLKQRREQNLPTVPGRLALQKQLSPFLRWDDPVLKEALGSTDKSDVETFAAVRKIRDNF